MRDLKKILCVVDPTSDEQPAIHRSAWLAQQTGAEVELLVCYYNQYLTGGRFFESAALEKARQDAITEQRKLLKKLAEPLQQSSVNVKTTAVWDHPLDEGIIRRAITTDADLVVKDTHHHSTLSRAMFSNTDWNLIRNCPKPLWLVKAREMSATPTFIAAIDPMNEHDKPAALDDELLQTCNYLGEKVGAEVHAFHSYDPRVAMATATANAYIPVSMGLDEIRAQMEEAHGKRFAEVTDFHEIGEERRHLVCGMAHEELPDTAKELSADVVVMGAVARNRWQRLFIGATAEKTLELLPCDLLVIKPDWFVTPVAAENNEAA